MNEASQASCKDSSGVSRRVLSACLMAARASRRSVVTRVGSTLTRAIRHCVRTRITLGAVADRELQGDGAVTGTSAPHALPEFRSEPGDQRVTRSAKSLRAGIPIIQVDVDRDTRHDDSVIAVACRGGRRVAMPVIGQYLAG